ncbi:DUF1501 domain-containing protein [Endozoicomonas arenosclerae]|uniref:DUF1501 domain-containing protein n=1 Tax=Endozoicomonas arenosclerae TaxID=1633495 RepID=UPI000AA3B860|nr:DUF1501 domain-containing protein [Endozoicomonas arenosclerae]
MKRREMIKLLGTGLALSPLSLYGAVPNTSADNKKLVWVVLRGAMDSLHAVMPTSDPHFLSHREKLAAPILDKALPLDRGFVLHPELSQLHQWYLQQNLSPVVAVASPYRSRSHFDAQDTLESGMPRFQHDSGWLGRALNVQNKSGLAVANSLPLSMRGSNQATTWYPSRFKEANEEFYDQLMSLYHEDPALLDSLKQGLKTRALAQDNMGKKRAANFIAQARAAGKLLSGEQSPDAIMLEMGGWDTHDNQANRLNRQLKQLNTGLTELQKSLGDTWKNTVVVIATEFGRTVKVNGTGGTDHGTASTLILAGGAFKGGKVLGD